LAQEELDQWMTDEGQQELQRIGSEITDRENDISTNVPPQIESLSRTLRDNQNEIQKLEAEKTRKLERARALNEQASRLPDTVSSRLVASEALVESFQNEGLDEWVLYEPSDKIQIGSQNYGSAIQFTSVDKMPPYKRLLAEYVAKERQIPFSVITRALLMDHLLRYQDRNEKPLEGSASNAEALEDWINTLLDKSQLSTGGSVSAVKPTLEKTIETVAGKPIVYNKDADSIADLHEENKLQCSSGSMFHQAACRILYGAAEYTNKNFVFIYESGHILPAQMTQSEDGSWTLTGFETTASGTALVDYGQVASLDGAFRIVDAELVFLTEIFREHISNWEEFIQFGLTYTAEKYGIPLKKLEAKIPEPKENKGESSAFAFGTPQVRPGDQERQHIERIERIQLIKILSIMASDKMTFTVYINGQPSGTISGFAQIDYNEEGEQFGFFEISSFEEVDPNLRDFLLSIDMTPGQSEQTYFDTDPHPNKQNAFKVERAVVTIPEELAKLLKIDGTRPRVRIEADWYHNRRSGWAPVQNLNR